MECAVVVVTEDVLELRASLLVVAPWALSPVALAELRERGAEIGLLSLGSALLEYRQLFRSMMGACS
ncbi:MAG: hypothetical protein CSA62_14995 [Planctomycetota bacterium]|nr:MAG: hypothetical protein CSA62_14995 [Planctomycetota bacterium]